MSTAIIILVNVALDAAIVGALTYVCTRATRLNRNGRALVATPKPSPSARQPAAAQWRLRGHGADARI
jgi:hypothetical protein